ncbi:MAG: hypothetical protein A2Y12_15125 [Planctomycetes bacterium GWF2_42_9]|nr:MAG: hypothetical protein A2Y12_15125 [Planctomycetes bacterium GWF2_42_9]
MMSIRTKQNRVNISFILTTFFLLSSGLLWGADLQMVNAGNRLYNEAYRPQFHFTYQVGWMSDINGPVYYDGEYHLFSQHCPGGPGLNYPNVHWGYAVSTDLIHWTELPPALAPDAHGPIFSGSCAIDWNNTSGFQSGQEKVIVAFYTAAEYILPSNKDGTQCIAYSNDRGRTWTKYAGNPVVNAITHYNRDPKVFWYAPTNKWVMVITLSGDCATDHRFAFLNSSNMVNWTETSRLDMPTACDCPDMFELSVDGSSNNKRWVLWGGDATYAVGTFNGQTFQREGPIRLPLVPSTQNGHVGYAAQSFSDIPSADGRRIQMTWLQHGSYPGMTFNQQASFPCKLSLRTFSDGIRLCRVPVAEIEKLHIKTYHWENHTLPPGQNLLSSITGELFDMRAQLEPSGAGQVTINIRGTDVVYNATTQKLSCLGATVDLPMIAGKVQLQILVDRTSIEIFGNDGAISLVYGFTPSSSNKTLGLYASGGDSKIVSLDVYKLKSAWLK